MHDSREDECRQHIGEITNETEDLGERRNSKRNDRNTYDFNNTKNDVFLCLDKQLSPFNLSLLNSFIDRFHPQRESSSNSNEHGNIQESSQSEFSRKRLHNIVLNTILYQSPRFMIITRILIVLRENDAYKNID